MTPAEIEKLLDLAKSGETRDLAFFAQAKQRLDDVVIEIDRFNATARGQSTSNSDLLAAGNWQKWVLQEKRRLQVLEITLADEKETARIPAVKSSARVQALDILLERAKKEQLALSRKRAEQNGVAPDA